MMGCETFEDTIVHLFSRDRKSDIFRKRSTFYSREVITSCIGFDFASPIGGVDKERHDIGYLTTVLKYKRSNHIYPSLVVKQVFLQPFPHLFD
jgi:hypothetical protein